MKTILLALLLACSAMGANDPLIVIDAKIEQLSSSYETYRSMFGGIVTREWANARVGVANIRYTGSRPQDVTVRFLFVGQDAAKGGLMLYHYHTVPLKLPAGGSARAVSISPVITKSRDQRRNADYGPNRRAEGITPFGWVVRVDRDGRQVAISGSTPDLVAGINKIVAESTAQQLASLDKGARDRMAKAKADD